MLIQRTLPTSPRGPHVAIIMDGNGRWARERGRPRLEGHRAGAGAVRRTVAAAPERGIATLTLFAFSSDNWRRPPGEVSHLMRLLRRHLRSEAGRCVREGVRVSVIGRRDRLGPDLVEAIEEIEARTRGGSRLDVRFAVDYSARDAILAATGLHRGGAAPSREDFDQLLARAVNARAPTPPVDLLIRTGGERRLSDFLLWECAYAELVFMPCLWPDFDEGALDSALREYRRRERRFGGLTGGPDDPGRNGREGAMSGSTLTVTRHQAGGHAERDGGTHG